MEKASNIKHYASKSDYQNKVDSKKSPLKKDDLKKTPKEVNEVSKSKPEATEVAKKLSTLNTAKEIASMATSAVSSAKPSVAVPVIKSDRSAEIQRIKDRLPINKPGIFFIDGSKFGTSSNTGVLAMSENIKGASYFDWDQADDIVEQIKRRPENQPIILMGHGLGGDTAVEVATELNSMENGFRKVNLLVTLDSVGFNNDIIPQNVEKNVNFIGDKNSIFNDAPNIARDSSKTLVHNELRHEDHSKLDDSFSIQFEIFNEINSTLSHAVVRKLESELDYIVKK